MSQKIDGVQRAERMDAFRTACRTAGLKVTHQRTEVFRELAASTEHPDAGQVFERVRQRIPAISADTVYRTLAFLEEQGLIRRVATPAAKARFDANLERHHHFTCALCGKVTDVYDAGLDQITVPTALSTLGEVVHVQVQFTGICTSCRQTPIINERHEEESRT